MKYPVSFAMADAMEAKRWLAVYEEIEQLVVAFTNDCLGWYSISEDTLADSIAERMAVRTHFSHEVFTRVMHNIRAHLGAFDPKSPYEFTAFHQEGKLWYSGSIPTDYTFDRYDPRNDNDQD